MIKGFIEVHDREESESPVLVNTHYIVDVRDNYIYLNDVLPIDTDYPYINCVEDYYEIKDKIKESTR